MKKFFTILMSMVLLLTMELPAFAGNISGNLKIVRADTLEVLDAYGLDPTSYGKYIPNKTSVDYITAQASMQTARAALLAAQLRMPDAKAMFDNYLANTGNQYNLNTRYAYVDLTSDYSGILSKMLNQAMEYVESNKIPTEKTFYMVQGSSSKYQSAIATTIADCSWPGCEAAQSFVNTNNMWGLGSTYMIYSRFVATNDGSKKYLKMRVFIKDIYDFSDINQQCKYMQENGLAKPFVVKGETLMTVKWYGKKSFPSRLPIGYERTENSEYMVEFPTPTF